MHPARRRTANSTTITTIDIEEVKPAGSSQILYGL
jgi:hypothetical protein